MPSWPPSRPKPDCLTPPNGAAGVGDEALVEADHAGLERLADAQRALEVAGVDVGDEAVLGVVGGGDRLVLVDEGRDRRDRAEDLLAEHAARRRARRRARSARRSSRRRRARCRRRAPWRPCSTASSTSSATLSRWSSSISGPTSTPSSVPRPTFSAPIRSASFVGELVGDRLVRRGSGWPTCRPRRCCASWRSSRPRRRRRGRRPRRRGTARCRRAPSRRCSTFSAACAISLRPTSVEPVKDSLRSRGSAMSGLETSLDDELVTTLSTPSGSPHSSRISASASIDSGVMLGGLDDHRAAGGDRRADLARAHRHREVPGRDEAARADRLAHDQHARRRRCRRPCSGRRSRTASPGEPAEELGRVGDLGLRLGERLAHLERHQQREIVGALVRAPRRRGAGSRRARAARCAAHSACAATAASSAACASSGVASATSHERLAGRGVLDGERLAAARRRATRRRSTAASATSRRTFFSRPLMLIGPPSRFGSQGIARRSPRPSPRLRPPDAVCRSEGRITRR